MFAKHVLPLLHFANTSFCRHDVSLPKWQNKYGWQLDILNNRNYCYQYFFQTFLLSILIKKGWVINWISNIWFFGSMQHSPSIFTRYVFQDSFSRSVNTVWKASKYGVFSGPYFPIFLLNTERFSECQWEKIWNRKNSVFGHFLRSKSLLWQIISSRNYFEYSTFTPGF